MQRINTPDGNFHPGDPSAGVKGTVVTQPFMQSVQEELAAVPESVGMKLNPADNKQLFKAIQKIVADTGANYQPKLDYTPVQQGTGAGQGPNVVKMGWAKAGSGLRVTVDTTDLGTIVFSDQLGAYATVAWVNQTLGAYATQQWVQGYAVKSGDGVPYSFTTNNEKNAAWLTINGQNRGRLWTDQNFDPGAYLPVNGRAYAAGRLYFGGADSVFNWAGQGGQPTWVWGGNSPENMYVYNPANFRVNYANSCDYANRAGSVNGVGNPASAGAQCQRAGATQSFGVVSGNPILPGPWVVVGLTGPGNGTANAITVYGDWMRNQ